MSMLIKNSSNYLQVCKKKSSSKCYCQQRKATLAM